MTSKNEKLILSQETLRLLTPGQPNAAGHKRASDTTIPMVCPHDAVIR